MARRDAAVEQLVEQARQQGFQAGLRQAEADSVQRQQSFVDEVSARLADALSELAALRPQLRRHAGEQVVELAMQVARKILRRTIDIDPDAVTGLVLAAVARIDAREVLEIRVAPTHHDSLKAALDRLGLPSQVQVSGDRSLEIGAVVVETSRGRLDASVSTQLAEIERGFADCTAAGRSS
jgi:flagellar assembly protein FliH